MDLARGIIRRIPNKTKRRGKNWKTVRSEMLALAAESNQAPVRYEIPPSVADKDRVAYRQDMESVRAMYAKWKELGLKNEDARFVLPNACVTEIVISANFREFRHIFQVRCARQAQWEIRQACCAMLKILQEKAPHIFEDLLPLLQEPG